MSGGAEEVQELPPSAPRRSGANFPPQPGKLEVGLRGGGPHSVGRRRRMQTGKQQRNSYAGLPHAGTLGHTNTRALGRDAPVGYASSSGAAPPAGTDPRQAGRPLWRREGGREKGLSFDRRRGRAGWDAGESQDVNRHVARDCPADEWSVTPPPTCANAAPGKPSPSLGRVCMDPCLAGLLSPTRAVITHPERGAHRPLEREWGREVGELENWSRGLGR